MSTNYVDVSSSLHVLSVTCLLSLSVKSVICFKMMLKVAKEAFTNVSKFCFIKSLPQSATVIHGRSQPLGVPLERELPGVFYSQKRFASSFKNPFKEHFEPKHPVKGDLVYVGNMYSTVKKIKLFSLSTSAIAVALQPVFLKELMVNATSATLTVALAMNACIFMTPLLLHIITKKYVTDMYYKEDDGTFTATTYSFFLRKKEHTFTAKDVTLPRKGSLFSFITIKRKTSLFLDPSLFLSKDAYVKMMRYDEPFDWEINQKEKESDSK